MWPDVIVLAEPLIDDGLSLSGDREPLGVEHLSTQSAVEPFVLSVLPGRTRIDPNGRDADPAKPILKGLGGELRPIAHQ